MFLNLNVVALGISGHQSELIELALTHDFKGMEFDLLSFAKQVDLNGYDHTARFIESAGLVLGSFDLPVNWQGDDAVFHEELERLPALAEVAARLGATGCRTVVMPASDDRPYHENFEFHRQRFTKIAEVLAPHSISLGIDFLATAGHREGLLHQFIHSPDALVTLAKTVGMDNVGVSVDLWQWQVAGANWDLFRELSAHEIVSVRVADVPPGVSNELISDEQRLLATEGGVIDMGVVISQLEIVEYSGPVTPFPHPSQLKDMTRNATIRAASKTLELKVVPTEEEAGGELIAATEEGGV